MRTGVRSRVRFKSRDRDSAADIKSDLIGISDATQIKWAENNIKLLIVAKSKIHKIS